MSVRVVFLGMLGALSALPFEALLTAGEDICAVIVPSALPGVTLRPLHLAAPISALPLQLVDANVLALARERRVPAWTVSDLRHPDSVGQLRALAPELLIVSCFRHILPDAWLAVPAHGGWNLHPSLLPRLRGPDPLFWTFHENAQPGVTVHRMSAAVDAGPILLQAPLTFPDGISYADAERICAHAGAELFRDALDALARGPVRTLPQQEADASYYPLPSPEHLMVTADWTVRHAFNFLNAISDLCVPSLRVAGRDFVVRKALDFSVGATPAEAWRICGDELTVCLADGVLRVLYLARRT